MISAPRGTKDLLPASTPKWRHVEEVARSLFARYGYEEIRTPIFEATELYARGVGETTDIVEKEMYTFEDRGGRSLTLRPEGTAGVVRAYIEHRLYTAPLTRLFYGGPFFRYERPQAGRFRQHAQLGAEALGSLDPALDAEVIGLAVQLFETLRMTGLEVRLNSIGCPECRPTYRDALAAYFGGRAESLCQNCRERLSRNPLRILDCKVDGCRSEAAGAPRSLESLCRGCAAHFAAVQRHLEGMGIPFTLASDLVRGLDYYTKTVFEVVSSALGAQSSVGGGGRYDGLVKLLGGPDKPAVGFATGIERIVMVLESLGIAPPPSPPPALFVAALGETAVAWAMPLVWRLRRRGGVARLGMAGGGLSALLKEGGRMNAKYALIVGENELAGGSVILRDMGSGSQEAIPLDRVEDHLLDRLTDQPAGSSCK